MSLPKSTDKMARSSSSCSYQHVYYFLKTHRYSLYPPCLVKQVLYNHLIQPYQKTIQSFVTAIKLFMLLEINVLAKIINISKTTLKALLCFKSF